MSSDINSITAVFLKVDDEWKPLKKRDFNQIMDGLNDESYARGTPEEYSNYSTDIYLDPSPSEVVSIRVTYQRTLDDIISSGIPVPRVWEEFVILGALARVFRRKGDYTRSQLVRNERNELSLTSATVKARETIDYRQVGVSVLRQRYP